MCRRAGFRRITLRGDTDFSQTKHLDRWDQPGDIRFIFGIDARENLKALAEGLPAQAYSVLVRPPQYEIKTEPRQRPERVKEEIVRQRKYETIHLLEEKVAEFEYRPVACQKSYRVVVLRKRLGIDKGSVRLREEIRYFFYITNDRTTPADQIVFQANDRCDQENLIAQLKSGCPRADGAGGQPGEQLGVHGDGVVGLEPEGLERVAGSRHGPRRREPQGGKTDLVADGVRDVPRGVHRHAVPDHSGRPTVDLSAAVVESVARDVPAVSGAAAELLVVLSE